MGQISKVLRRAERGHAHWCPACEEMHVIPDSWTFDGNLEKPTFQPSVRISGKQHLIVNGKWTGEWVRGPDGKALDYCCHYVLTAGVLDFKDDCTHALRSRLVPLPELPPELRDPA